MTKLVPAGLERDIVVTTPDPRAPISTKKKPKEWAAVQAQLQALRGMKTISENIGNRLLQQIFYRVLS